MSSETRPADDATAPPETTAAPTLKATEHDPGEPRFRILRRGAWRQAFKLEEIFWRALELAAGRAGAKLTDYVQDLVSARPRSRNQSSGLRVHAARWLLDALAAAEQRIAAEGPENTLQTVPVPGFIIAERRGLIAYNGEFSRFVARTVERERAPPLTQAKLALDAPLARIIETLASSPRRDLDCGFALLLDQRRVRGRVRVSVVTDRSGNPAVMGFVMGVDPAMDAGDS